MAVEYPGKDETTHHNGSEERENQFDRVPEQQRGGFNTGLDVVLLVLARVDGVVPDGPARNQMSRA